MRVYHARWVVPISAAPIANGSVAVRGRSIAYVGPRAGAPRGVDVELGDAVLLPGLVNAHTHLELTAMRGFLEDADFFTWVRRLTRARTAVLTDAMLLDSARLGIAEGLRAGITTFADTSMCGLVTMTALVEAGARGIVYQEIFGPHPDQHAASMAGLRSAVVALRAAATDLVRVGVSPHAPYSVHEDLLVDACAWAVGERLPIAMHLAESRDEQRYLREGEGPFAEMLRGRGISVVRRAHSAVHLLKELGVLDVARPLLIHCVTLDDSDVAFIAGSGCPVAHCPASNAKLGHGIAPVVELRAAGAVVALGSDSVASNNRMDLLDEARLATLMQRARLARGDALSHGDALRMATIDGARALGLEREIGSLEVGKDADLAAFPLAAALSGARAGAPVFDPESALVFALPGTDASLVTIAGVERVRDGRVLGLDAGLVRRVQATADLLALWSASDDGEA